MTAPLHRTDPIAGAGDAALGWAAVGVLAVGGAGAFVQRVLEWGPLSCSLRAALGVPCPTCGLSTVAADLVRVDPAAALRRDPLGAALLVALAVVAVVHLVRTFVRPVVLPARAAAIGLVAIALAHWAATLSGVVHLAPLP